MLNVETSRIDKEHTELNTLAIVTRLSRSARYMNRVLDGLICQSGVQLEWSIVTEIPMTPEHKNCVKRARNYGIKVIVTQVAPGHSLGHLANTGVRATSSQFILLHDDDDLLTENFALPAIKILMTTIEYVAVTCHAAIIHETNTHKTLDYVLSPGRNYVKYAQLSWNNLIATNSMIYRRDIFNQINGYPEDVPVAEDWIFNLKLVRIGKITILPKVCSHVFIRKKRHSSNNENNTNNIDHLKMRSKIRKMAKESSKDPFSRFDKIKYLSLRCLDRLTYKFFENFLPR